MLLLGERVVKTLVTVTPVTIGIGRLGKGILLRGVCWDVCERGGGEGRGGAGGSTKNVTAVYLPVCLSACLSVCLPD